jgi:hypothetical protein
VGKTEDELTLARVQEAMEAAMSQYIAQRNDVSTRQAIKAHLEDMVKKYHHGGEKPEFDVQIEPNERMVNIVPLNDAAAALFCRIAE